MNDWNVLHMNINKNLVKLLSAQASAEEKGDPYFHCPVCGGEAFWGRSANSGRLVCGCTKCGMYLRG